MYTLTIGFAPITCTFITFALLVELSEVEFPLQQRFHSQSSSDETYMYS